MSARDEGAQDPARWQGENLLGFALVEARERLRRVPSPRLPPDAVEPPWIAFPGVHPYEIHWRMGAGESHLMRFGAWWDGLGEEERLHVEGV